LKVSRRFGGTYRLNLQGRRISRARNQRESKWQVVAEVNRLCLPSAFALVSCSAYSSTLKIEAIYSSETSVDFQLTTWRSIPEDSTFYHEKYLDDDSYLSYFEPKKLAENIMYRNWEQINRKPGEERGRPKKKIDCNTIRIRTNCLPDTNPQREARINLLSNREIA
jgi:hypothetical protein